MTDEALLALIVDDADTLQVLAAWGALALQLEDIADGTAASGLINLLSLSEERVDRALRKLRVARVLVDGGISDLADVLLQTTVKARLDGAKRGKR